MSINLNKFTQSKEVIVPIVKNTFQYNRKKYTNFESIGLVSYDGWWKIRIEGNIFHVINSVSPEIELSNIKTVKGYVYNNNLIFQNFDVGKRKTGADMMMLLHLNNAPTFSSIKAVLWEDHHLYYYGINYIDTKIYEVNSAYNNKDNITNLKGITPELKTLYLFHELERQALQLAVEKAQKEENLKKWRETLPGRLHTAFERVGGKLIEYSISGSRLIVDWILGATGRQFNSVLDAKTFCVIEAGYCISGEDKRHNITSMILTAEEYEKDGLTYITRRG